MVHERTAAPKHKNHAQDCGTLIDQAQRPAILPWLLSFGWRPSFRLLRAPCPLRPAAGLLLGAFFKSVISLETAYRGLPIMPFSHDERCESHSRSRSIMQKRAPT